MTEATLAYVLTNSQQAAENLFSEGILPTLFANPEVWGWLVLGAGLWVVSASKKLPDPFPVPADRSGRAIYFGLGCVCISIGLSIFIHNSLPKDSLLQSRNPEELYLSGSSLEGTGNLKRQALLYERAAKMAQLKVDDNAAESSFMKYIEAKSSYKLGITLFKLKRYSDAIPILSLALARYKSNDGFSGEYESTIKERAERINMDGKFDKLEAYEAYHYVAKSYHQKGIESQKDRDRYANFQAAIDTYRQILKEDPTENIYFRGNVWNDLGQAYQELGRSKEAKLSFFSSYLVNRDNPYLVDLLEGYQWLDTKGNLIWSEEERMAIFLGSDGVLPFHPNDSRSSAGSDDGMSGLDFLVSHYDEMKKVVAVDDINTLEDLYRERYHKSFQDRADIASYRRFWIDEVSSIDEFKVIPADEGKSEFLVSLCLRKNGLPQTLTVLFPLIQSDFNWLIGEGKNPQYQEGCNF